MPTNDEVNAFFDAIQPELSMLITRLPYFEQGTASTGLNSQEGRQEQVVIIRKGLAAAEAARAKAVPPKSP